MRFHKLTPLMMRPFTYDDEAYIAAATKLRQARNDYFREAGNPDGRIVDELRMLYYNTRALVRKEEDRITATH